jgi:hypothetical protein
LDVEWGFLKEWRIVELLELLSLSFQDQRTNLVLLQEPRSELLGLAHESLHLSLID